MKSIQIKLPKLLWNPNRDEFIIYITAIDEAAKITKRNAISETSRWFDLLVLLVSTIVQVKLYLQNLWQQKLNWDKIGNIHRNVSKEFPKWIHAHITFPMHPKKYSEPSFKLLIKEHWNNFVKLLCTKSWLPRLELCAAVLLPLLAKKVIMAMKIDFSNSINGQIQRLHYILDTQWTPTRWKHLYHIGNYNNTSAEKKLSYWFDIKWIFSRYVSNSYNLLE